MPEPQLRLLLTLLLADGRTVFCPRITLKDDKMDSAQLTNFTPATRRRWEQIPLHFRELILENVWCGQCGVMVHMQVLSAAMVANNLVLSGTCKSCGGKVARLIEPE